MLTKDPEIILNFSEKQVHDILTLPSIINFEKGLWVSLNPFNHGLKTSHKAVIAKACEKKGEIRIVHMVADMGKSYPTYLPTGELSILWAGDYHAKKYYYRNLIIVEKP